MSDFSQKIEGLKALSELHEKGHITNEEFEKQKKILLASSYKDDFSEPPIKQKQEAISLWNPNAAVNWSVLFTPIFGAIIHAKNWEALGEFSKAGSSRIWAGLSFLVSLAIFWGNFPRDIAIGFALIWLIVWYYFAATIQAEYFKEKLKDQYIRKDWYLPVAAAAAVLAGIVFVTSKADIGDLSNLASDNPPECNSKTTISTLKGAIEGQPDASVNIKVFDVEDIEQATFDEVKLIRECSGTALTNAGKIGVRYRVEARKNGEYLVETTHLWQK